MTRPSAIAFAAFVTAMRDLHLRAGEPSYRDMARDTRRLGRSLSHTTVRAVIKGPSGGQGSKEVIRLPRWENVKTVVEVLHGDIVYFQELWQAAERASRTPPDHVDATPVVKKPPDNPTAAAPAPTVPGYPGPASGPSAVRTVARREPAWSADLDLSSAAPIMQVLAAAAAHGLDVMKVLMDIAPREPLSTAPAIAFLAERDLRAVAHIVAAAAQDHARVADLLADLLPALHGEAGADAPTVQARAGMAAAVVIRMLDQHQVDPLSLVQTAVLLCRPPLLAHRPLARRIVTDAVRIGPTDKVAATLLAVPNPVVPLAIILHAMFVDPGCRHEASHLLAWLTKMSPPVSVPTFFTMIMRGPRARRAIGDCTLLSIVAHSYRRWADLLAAGAFVAQDQESRAPIAGILAQLLTDLADDDVHLATTLVAAFARRTTKLTMSALSVLADQDTELAAGLLLELARDDEHTAGQIPEQWFVLRHPYIAAPSGIIIAGMTDIDPTLTAHLLIAVNHGHAPRFPPLTGLDQTAQRRIYDLLQAASHPVHHEQLRVLLSIPPDRRGRPPRSESGKASRK